MQTTWLDPGGHLLGPHCPLPLDLPFTGPQAAALGVSRTQLSELLGDGFLRRVLRGVYAAAQAPDDIWTRAGALQLVVSEHAVVAGRTAAWLHGVDILQRSALLIAPPVEVVHHTDTRVRRPGVDGRRRLLRPDDICRVGGVQVTTPLRTALDLGRSLWRYDALAAVDAFLRAGVDHDEMRAHSARFRGYRGVRQLRMLLPIADGRSESPGESALRLHWHDAGLTWPECQWWVPDDDGELRYRLDMADPVVGFAAEYDGEEHHTSEVDRAHDEERRAWLARRGWSITVFTKREVYDRRPDPLPILVGGHTSARRTHQIWTPGRVR